MRLILSFAALFLSTILLQISSGAVAPLDALSGIALGFSASQIGALGSAHFVGFFIGCWCAPRLMGSIGHSRCFAVFTALGAMGLILHVMVFDPIAWAFFRVATGICIAGSYTVIESWLQAKLTNETRGRAMGLYRVIDLGAVMVAQLMIGFLEPASYISYNLLAIFCCAALLPLALTKVTPPAVTQAPRLRPMLAARNSPLAVSAVISAGITTASFRMVGPVYGAQVGLSVEQIASFLALCIFGGALAQYPVGIIADRVDRRHVLIGLSVCSIISCAITVLFAGSGTLGIMLTATLFGFTTFPIYSVASAHANDHIADDQRIELSAALIFWYAVGAIGAPLISAELMTRFGPTALFVFIALIHTALASIAILRMILGPKARIQTAYTYTPRTTLGVGQWLKRDPSKTDKEAP